MAAAHGATLIRRQSSGGPGAARNTGLGGVTSELVAFLDSDCRPGPGWIERLAGHFADPAVAAAAPRMTAVPGGPGWASRYTSVSCCLDLGAAEARVVPGHPRRVRSHRRLLVRRAVLPGSGLRRLPAFPRGGAAPGPPAQRRGAGGAGPGAHPAPSG